MIRKRHATWGRQTLSILLSLVMVVSMMPSSAAWGTVRTTASDGGAQAALAPSSATYQVQAGVTSSGTISVSAGSASGTTLDAVSPGETVTVSATPAEGYYLAQVRVGKNAVAGEADSQVYEALTAGADGSYTFTMPEQNVQVYADFVSIVWDGTMDVTWYNTTDTSFTIKYAAQYAGLAAIVNGIFNNYPTSANDAGIQVCDYGAYLAQMGVRWLDAQGKVVTDWSQTDESSTELGSALYGEFTSTNTIFDTQGQTASSSLSADIATTVQSTQRVVGNADYVKANSSVGIQREGSQNLVTTQTYFYGIDNFNGKTVNIAADLDFGGKKTDEGTWDTTTSPLFMPVGGQYIMLPLVIWQRDSATGAYSIQCSNGYNHIGSSFCGTLDGHGHSFSNIYCERYGYGSNFGDSQSVGIVGRLGIHDNDYKGQGVQPPVNPTVRCICVESGYIASRRSVGGIVGKIGHTSRTDLDDGSTGGIIEYCINKADVFNTDAKGVGGICGASFNGGCIRYCANFGTVTSTYSDPEGGIVGYNENSIINCYNVGTVTNPSPTLNARFCMGIASHNGGDYVIQNDYWLLGSALCDYNSASYQYGGYYGIVKGTTPGQSNNGTWSFGGSVTTTDGTVTYAADYPTLTAALLNDDGAEIWKDATSGANDGYPELYYQAKGYQEATYTVTVEQPSVGGTIYVDKTSGTYGTTVTITSQSETGYTIDGYSVNGQPIEGNTFILTGDATVTATPSQLKAYAFHYDQPDTDLYTFSATKDGIVIEGGQATRQENVPVAEGDTVYQSDVIQVTLTLKEGAAPEDVTKEYTGNYVLKLGYTDAATQKEKSKTLSSSSKTLSYTVTGAEDTTAGFTLSLGSLSTALKSWSTQADTSWYDAQNPQENYVLTTPEQLAGFNALLGQKVTFEGVTISLGADISLANADGTDAVRYWQPQGSSAYTFKGIFDGAGYTISGMTVGSSSSSTTSAAFIGYATGATVENLTVAGEVYGKTYAAGIVGCAERTQFEKVTSEVAVHGSASVGGVVAQLKVGSLANCMNRGSVSGSATSVGTNGVGGLCGFAQSANLSSCQNQGAVTALVGYVGGLVGYASAVDYATNGGTEFSQCANFAPITVAGSASAVTAAGGLCGNAVYTSVDQSLNAGAIAVSGSSSGKKYAGGLVGYTTSTTSWNLLSVSNSFNVGAVSVASSATTNELDAAGILGSSYNAGWDFTNCYTTGAVSVTGGSAQNAGQFVGKRGTTVSDASYDLNNCLYLEGATVSSYDGTATAQSVDQMKSAAAQLGNAYCASTEVVRTAYPALSEGYPVLTWLSSGAKIDLSGATIAAIPNQTYTGSAIEPTVSVTLGDSTLAANTDYTVSYSNNVEPGTATVTVTGAGIYEGTVTTTFQITKPLPSFPDVSKSDWFYQSVCDATSLGLFSGFGDGTFGPNKTLTRAQAAVVLWRYFAPEEAAAYSRTQATTKNETPMADVANADWYTGAANWAYKNDVISGKKQADGSKLFDPNGQITREQMCAVVANAAIKFGGAEVKGANRDKMNAMPDCAQVSSWAVESVAWSLNNRVISGKAQGSGRIIAPGDSVTRAEAAAIFVNTIKSGLWDEAE